MGADTKKQEVVDKNYAAFQELLPQIMGAHANQFALLRDGKIVEYFDTIKDAVAAGNQLYRDELFSVQEVTDSIVDLGFYSHAVPLWRNQQ